MNLFFLIAGVGLALIGVAVGLTLGGEAAAFLGAGIGWLIGTLGGVTLTQNLGV